MCHQSSRTDVGIIFKSSLMRGRFNMNRGKEEEKREQEEKKKKEKKKKREHEVDKPP